MSLNKTPLFRIESLEFQKNRLHGDVLVVPSISQTLVVAILFSWLLLTFYWLFSSSYTSKETVVGWLESPKGIVRIYSESTTGRVKQLLVNEGDFVKSEQPLAIISGDHVLENGEHLETNLLAELLRQLKIIQEQLRIAKKTFDIKRKNLKERVSASEVNVKLIESQISILSERKLLIEQREENYKEMSVSGHVSTLEYNILKEKKLEATNDYQSLLRSRVNQNEIVNQLKSELSLLPEEHQDEISRLEATESDLSQSILRLKGRKSNIIKATTSGIVSNLQARQGQRVNPNLPILTIVPSESEIDAYLLVPVRAIGFVKENQYVDIRYDSFSYQKYGLYSGEVYSVSETVLLPEELTSYPVKINEPTYLVRVRLNSQTVIAYGNNIPLKSGMTLSADIQISKRSLLEWLLEPILSLKGRV